MLAHLGGVAHDVHPLAELPLCRLEHARVLGHRGGGVVARQVVQQAERRGMALQQDLWSKGSKGV